MAGSPGTINSRMFKADSIIYFEGDSSEVIYILKSGKLVLKSINLNTGEELTEGVKLGEFFGVKSALGRYPREETAQTLEDTVVLVLTLQDFERLILKNVDVVKKMLRVFSNQLRRIHKNVRSAMGPNDIANPATELFKIGEYYYKAGVPTQALYAYQKYLEFYPGCEYVDEATQRIASIQSGRFNVSGDKPLPVDSIPKPAFDISPSFQSQGSAGFGFDSNKVLDSNNSDPFASNASSRVADELGDFLSGDPFGRK